MNLMAELCVEYLRMEVDADVHIVRVDFLESEHRLFGPQLEGPLHLLAHVANVHVLRTATNTNTNKSITLLSIM